MESPDDFHGYDDDWEWDEEWDCTWCGGEGFDDDPSWDDWVDENGYAPCKACGGTGLRKDQTMF